MADQDKAGGTNFLKNKILKEEIKSKFRLSKQHAETTDRLNSGRLILKNNDYLTL